MICPLILAVLFQPLNRFIAEVKFKMTSVFEVPDLVCPGDWAAKFDLTQAYYHVYVQEPSQVYLRFIWQGRIFQFQVLPFGIHTAPWLFTTIGNAVTLHLRFLGVRLALYLDDGLVLASSEELCRTQVNNIVLPLLADLGLTVNLQKSALVPSRQFTFLGFHWDTISMCCKLPLDRLLNIKYLVGLALESNPCSLHLLLRVLGICTAARLAVPLARLRSRFLQKLILLRYTSLQSLHSKVWLSQQVLDELRWWSGLDLHQCAVSFRSVPVSTAVLLATDASASGWSYVLDGRWVSGAWPPSQISLHINHKEYLVLEFALFQNLELVMNKVVLWEVDNTTALAYIRNEGGTADWQLCQRVVRLLLWCQDKGVVLLPKYVPSAENLVADRGSRFQLVEDWFLLPRVVRRIFRLWGIPEIDLMATNRSTQLPVYFAFDRSDTGARAIDAFAQPWEFRLAYLFPPPPIILKALNKIKEAPVESTFLVVLPW